MLPQKIQVIPFLNSSNQSIAEPLLFWKKIKNKLNQEIHCFLQVEGRNKAETEELSREFWAIVDNYLQDSISQNIFPFNAENLCEEILKIFNQFLFGWGESHRVQNFQEFNIFFGVSSPHAFHFSKLGNARVFLIRNGELIQVDERMGDSNLQSGSSPFSEVTGGFLKANDRFLIASSKLAEAQSPEEIFSLIREKDMIMSFYNMVQSIEVLGSPVNVSFVLADVCPGETPDVDLPQELFGSRLKEYTIFDNLFLEFNSLEKNSKSLIGENFEPKNQVESLPKTSFWVKPSPFFGKVGGFLSLPFSYVSKRTEGLSFFRKSVLFAGISFFIIFLSSVGYFFLNKPQEETEEKIDYGAMFNEANKLVEDSRNSLIYKDENKARKELGEAEALLEKVSQSGDFGIKAVKLKKEVREKINVLDRASGASSVSLIFDLPEGKEKLSSISYSGGTFALFSKNAFWIGKLAENKFSPKEKNIAENSEEKNCVFAQKNSLFLTYPQSRFFYEITLSSEELGGKKNFNGGSGTALSSCASFGNFVYFWNSKDKQIEQFNLNEKKELNFAKNWISVSLKEEFKDDDAVSLAVDGSVFLLTKNGAIIKFSGGKKAPFDFEKPANQFKGENLKLKTQETQKNLYLLDKDRERIIIYDKETGKMKTQIQDKILKEALDFEVLEDKNEIYFVSEKSLFKVDFKIEEKKEEG